jgi:hypothetical protein
MSSFLVGPAKYSYPENHCLLKLQFDPHGLLYQLFLDQEWHFIWADQAYVWHQCREQSNGGQSFGKLSIN